MNLELFVINYTIELIEFLQTIEKELVITSSHYNEKINFKTIVNYLSMYKNETTENVIPYSGPIKDVLKLVFLNPIGFDLDRNHNLIKIELYSSFTNKIYLYLPVFTCILY